jgi:PAS domain S-box-containing protein
MNTGNRVGPSIGERAQPGDPSVDEALAVLLALAGEALTAPERDAGAVNDSPEAPPLEMPLGLRPATIVLDSARRVQHFDALAERLFQCRAHEVRDAPIAQLLMNLSEQTGVHAAIGRRANGTTFNAWTARTELGPPQGPMSLLSLWDGNSILRCRAHQAEAWLRYQNIVEQIPAVTFGAALHRDVRELYISPQIESLLGYTQQEWLSNPVLWYERLHPDDRQKLDEEFARGCKAGGPFRADCRFRARNGDIVWVHGEARLICDKRGRPLFVQGVAFDITESKRLLGEQAARAAAEREEQKARLLADISLTLSGSFTERPRLAAVASRLVPACADWCIIDVIDEPHAQYRAAVAHADPAKRSVADALWQQAIEWNPGSLGEGVALTSVAISSRATDADPDPTYGGLTEAIEPRSSLRITLRASGRVLGVISLFHAESSRSYTEESLSLAREIGDRCAMALENSRLQREAEWLRARADSMHRVTDAALWCLDFDSMVGELLELLRHALAADTASLLLLTADHRYFEERARVGSARTAQRVYVPVGSGLESQIAARRQTVIFNDLSAVAAPADTQQRLGSLAGRSIVVGDTVVGIVQVGSHAPHAFGEDAAELLELVSERAARAIERSQIEDLGRALRFSDLFVGILGHDLRNPLSAIIMAASLIYRRADSDRLADPARRILNSADRMRRMIDQILDFTRIRMGGGIPLVRKKVDLSKVCQFMIDELASGDRGAKVELDVAGDVSGVWDEDRLSQVASNLIGNALQHRSSPGSSILIRLDGTDPDQVILDVWNAGTMPDELRPVLFEPLRTSADRKLAGSSGLGLGLYITHQIVTAHKGSIDVQSSEATGTRFVVRIPRNPAEERATPGGAGPLASQGDDR